jgi:hypothetical protein
MDLASEMSIGLGMEYMLVIGQYGIQSQPIKQLQNVPRNLNTEILC